MKLILSVEDIFYIVDLQEGRAVGERTGEIGYLVLVADEAFLSQHSYGCSEQIFR